MQESDNIPEPATIEALKILGHKWTVFVLKQLSTGTKRFNELQHNTPGISQKMLTDTLRSLEKDGLVIRKVFPEIPPHVEYRLSPAGEALTPIMFAIHDWGRTHLKLKL